MHPTQEMSIYTFYKTKVIHYLNATSCSIRSKVTILNDLMLLYFAQDEKYCNGKFFILFYEYQAKLLHFGKNIKSVLSILPDT